MNCLNLQYNVLSIGNPNNSWHWLSFGVAYCKIIDIALKQIFLWRCFSIHTIDSFIDFNSLRVSHIRFLRKSKFSIECVIIHASPTSSLCKSFLLENFLSWKVKVMPLNLLHLSLLQGWMYINYMPFGI